MIPIAHGRSAHAVIEGSRLEVFPKAGHFPYLDSPLRFVSTLTDFMRSTRPAHLNVAQFGEVVRSHGARVSAAVN